MSSIFKILNIANMALASQQFAITVAGHNIANANTEGFSRQKVIFNSAVPALTGRGFLGSGVDISSVQRIQDRFIGIRINSELQIFGKLEQQTAILEQIETIFNEGEGIGLSDSINDFFNAWQSLAGNANQSSERSNLLDMAQTMSDRFNKMDSDLKRLRKDTDKKIVDILSEINSITSQIADLNDQIHQTEIGDTNANDLRDSRDLLLKKLSQKINIDFFEDDNNIVNVVTSNGYSLVERLSSFTLTAAANASDASIHDVQWEDASGNLVDITSIISGGELAGLLDLRDNLIVSYNKQLGSVAAGIINEVNKLHYSGYGMDGDSGINFFMPLSVSATPDSNNTGTASVSGSVADPSALLRDDYEIRITSAGTFTLQNTTRNTASGTFTFTSGTAVLLPQGLSVTITGAANSGDIFEVSVNKNAAMDMSINPVILNNINKIAASQGGNGDDGNNAQSIADLQDTYLMSPASAASGVFTFTIQDFYSSLVSEIGTDSKKAADSLSQQEGIINQLENLNEAVSGVSIDEEMLAIIQFQRAYEAAARLINIVDEMLGAIIKTL